MKTRLALLAALGVLAALGLFYLSRNDPEGGAPYPQCVFKQVTGLYCAGCGATRAAHALVHLEVAAALRKNPLLVIGLPFLLLGVAMEGTAWLLGERYRGPRARLRGIWIWTLPAVIIGFWVLRNIPTWPFSMLAPH